MIELEIFQDINDIIVNIRREVFVIEQNISEKDEFEGGEDTFTHFCLFKDRSLAGYIRIAVDDRILHIGRVAVKKNFRKQGLGSLLMKTVEDYGVSKGCDSFILHAQLKAKNFYQKLGYITSGDEFIEAGIVHIVMTKDILKDRNKSRCSM